MNQCKNCGQFNNYSSNFCRSCGTRMTLAENQNARRVEQSFENHPPRPHVWKTDEFQIGDAPARRTEQFNQAQLPLNRTNASQNNFAPPVPFYRQPLAYGYRCPRCGTQNLPFAVEKISPVGWGVFAVLLLVFFPLFWVGLLIKENVKICPVCNAKVN